MHVSGCFSFRFASGSGIQRNHGGSGTKKCDASVIAVCATLRHDYGRGGAYVLLSVFQAAGQADGGGGYTDPGVYLGDKDARIDCDEEGELYRLFHEINSLAAILNAQAQKEGQSREFLKNTISDISHQLKTPLAALNIYNGIIQTEAEAGGFETIRKFAGLSEQELDRIETLVQNLLKITKFDAGTMVIEKRQENISEIMAEVEKHFAFRVGQEEKQIVLSGSDPLLFSCDRSWISEALDNLVKNALDHTEGGDSIWMTWERNPSAVRITVKDNGSGIHPEDLHHIFKRFYRSRYSQDTQGIGLGLPLVRAVAQVHGGTVSVDSRLGEGTTFVLLFLVAEKAEQLNGGECEAFSESRA